ncbi:hypothetical protein [Phaffia rhodozyma]|uniref:Uncharacterized protein n=1 Tax=Phaffia rhodozyma TaxID=264483 RepID=A0A0F7SJQ6_PHARH|nr:hypothetical protein [Phaffia rhodozyma]
MILEFDRPVISKRVDRPASSTSGPRPHGGHLSSSYPMFSTQHARLLAHTSLYLLQQHSKRTRDRRRVNRLISLFCVSFSFLLCAKSAVFVLFSFAIFPRRPCSIGLQWVCLGCVLGRLI